MVVRANIRHRVSLKEPSYADYEHFFDMRFSDEVVYWADDGPQILSKDEYARTRLMMLRFGQVIERVIVLDGESIGTVSARPCERIETQCILSIVIAIPELWGLGYGSVALKLFLVELWELGFKVAVLETYANNRRAQRCFTKLGFVKRRAYFSGHTGRFVLEMVCALARHRAIGEVVRPGDPRWKQPLGKGKEGT